MRLSTKLVANLLIALPLVSTLYIYLPILQQEFNYRFAAHAQEVTIPKSPGFGIIIDKIGVNDTITEGVDPFNQSEYLPVLHHSIAHAKGSSLPGQDGNIFLFAHSSDNPFSITRYNTSFYLLDKLSSGDQITLYYQGEPSTYSVREKQVVKPSQIQALTQKTRSQLTLQTCTPVGTSLNRLLVFADPV